MSYVPQVLPRGPARAKILIVGEAPGKREVDAHLPFVGPSGYELEKMLREAGINPDLCRYTNVVNIRPDGNRFEKSFMFSSKKAAQLGGGVYHRGQYVRPIVLDGIRELEREIETCDPNVIVPVGNIPLWAITGNWGITKWRRSEISARVNDRERKVVPTYHPAAILRTWEWRPIAVQDFRIIRREAETPDVYKPDYDFLLRPNYRDTIDYIADLTSRIRPGFRLAVDVETRNRQIACIALARSHLQSICIPIQSIESPTGSYWTLEEETEIMWALRDLLTKAYIVGQNFSYDNQYFARNYGFICNLVADTLFKQHVCFPGLPKGLDFLSSMYREHHTYWKDEGKNWDPRTTHEDQLWNYNCIDSVATYECDTVLDKVVDKLQVRAQLEERMLTMRNAYVMMLRGVNSDMNAKLQLSSELAIGLAHMKSWWKEVVDFDIFGQKGVSNKKLFKFVYDLLKLPAKYKRNAEGERKLTADKEAIQEWEETCEPIFRPLLAFVRHYRSMLVFKSTFADQQLDQDDRWRCTYGAGLAVTFRWISSEDAFGFGTNLANIPKGDDR